MRGRRLQRIHARRCHDTQVDRHDGRKLYAKCGYAAVDFATHEKRARFFTDCRGKRRHRPIEQLGQDLANLIRITIDGLFAHQDDVGFFFLNQRFERAGYQITIEFVVGRVHANRAISARRQAGA